MPDVFLCKNINRRRKLLCVQQRERNGRSSEEEGGYRCPGISKVSWDVSGK
jgi:hypothetical protein